MMQGWNLGTPWGNVSAAPTFFTSHCFCLSLLPLPALTKLRAQTWPPGGISVLYPISMASTYLPSIQGFNTTFVFILLSTMGKNAGTPKPAKKMPVSVTQGHLSVIWPPGSTKQKLCSTGCSLFLSLTSIRLMPQPQSQPTGFWLMKRGQWHKPPKAWP